MSVTIPRSSATLMGRHFGEKLLYHHGKDGWTKVKEPELHFRMSFHVEEELGHFFFL